jgi:hypothetical protein
MATESALLQEWKVDGGAVARRSRVTCADWPHGNITATSQRADGAIGAGGDELGTNKCIPARYNHRVAT